MGRLDDFDAEFGDRSWHYNERDIPANQLFQNLESRIKERMRGWEQKSFEEKIQIEMELASYKENLRLWARANGVKLPNLDRIDASDLDKLEALHRRELLIGRIADTEGWIRRLAFGKEQAKVLHEAYEELILHDPRVNPHRRDELLKSLKPEVHQEAMRTINRAGGLESPAGVSHLLAEPPKMEKAIKSLLDSNPDHDKGRYVTTLVPMNTAVIESYVRNYFTLEVIFKALHWRIREEERNLRELNARLREHGGPLSLQEAQHIETFASGRNPDYNIGRHLADLDLARIEGEKYLKRGKGKQ